jgi:hypothetical protein
VGSVLPVAPAGGETSTFVWSGVLSLDGSSISKRSWTDMVSAGYLLAPAHSGEDVRHRINNQDGITICTSTGFMPRKKLNIWTLVRRPGLSISHCIPRGPSSIRVIPAPRCINASPRTTPHGHAGLVYMGPISVLSLQCRHPCRGSSRRRRAGEQPPQPPDPCPPRTFACSTRRSLFHIESISVRQPRAHAPVGITKEAQALMSR